MKIEELALCGRTYNCLKRAEIDTVEQLREMTDRDLRRIRGMGIISIEEINRKLQTLNRTKSMVETNIYDVEEIHHNCTVQILRNSVTGEQSIGWWPEDQPPVEG